MFDRFKDRLTAQTKDTSGAGKRNFDRFRSMLGKKNNSPAENQSAGKLSPTQEEVLSSSSTSPDNKNQLKLTLNAYTDPKPPLSDHRKFLNRRFQTFKVLSPSEQQALAEQLYSASSSKFQLTIKKALYSYSLTQILQALLICWRNSLDPQKFLFSIAQQAAPSNLLASYDYDAENEDSDSEDEEDSTTASKANDKPFLEDIFEDINLNAISSANDVPWIQLILGTGKDINKVRILLSVIIKTVLATKFFKENIERKQLIVTSNEQLKIKLTQLMIGPDERLRNGSTVEELILYGYSLEDIIDGLMECYEDQEVFNTICLRSTKLKNNFSVTDDIENKIELFITKAKSSPSFKLQHAQINFNDFELYVRKHSEYKYLLCEQIVVASIFSFPLIDDRVISNAFEKINTHCHKEIMSTEPENHSRESIRLSLMQPVESQLEASTLLEEGVKALLLNGVEDKAIINCYCTSMKFWMMKKQQDELKNKDASTAQLVREASSMMVFESGIETSSQSSFELTIQGLVERMKPLALSQLTLKFNDAFHNISETTFAAIETLKTSFKTENAHSLLVQVWPVSENSNALLSASTYLLKLFKVNKLHEATHPLIELDEEQAHRGPDGDQSAVLTNGKKLGLLSDFIESSLYFFHHGEEGEFPQRLSSIGVTTLDDVNAMFGLLKNQRLVSEEDTEQMHQLFSRWLLNAKGTDLISEIITSRQTISSAMTCSEEAGNYSKALHGTITNHEESRAHDEDLLCENTLYSDTDVPISRLHFEFPKLSSSENFIEYRSLLNQLDDFVYANQYELAQPLLTKTSWLKSNAYQQALEEAHNIIKKFIIDNIETNIRESLSTIPFKETCITLIKLLLFPYGNEPAFADINFSKLSIDTFKTSTGHLAKRYSNLNAQTQRVLKLIVLVYNFKPTLMRSSLAATLAASDQPKAYLPSGVDPFNQTFSLALSGQSCGEFAGDCINLLHIYISFLYSSYVAYKKYSNTSNFHALLDQMTKLEANLNAIKSMSVDFIEKLSEDIKELEKNDDKDIVSKVQNHTLIILFLKVVFTKKLDRLLDDLVALRFEEFSQSKVEINIYQHSDYLETLREASDFSSEFEKFELYVSQISEINNPGSSAELAMLCVYMLIKPLIAEGKVDALKKISQSTELMQLITKQTVLLVLNNDKDGFDILQLLMISSNLVTEDNAQIIDQGLSSIRHYRLISFNSGEYSAKNTFSKIIILQILYTYEAQCILSNKEAKKCIDSGDRHYLNGLIGSFSESLMKTYLMKLLVSSPELDDLIRVSEYVFTNGDLNVIKNKSVMFDVMFQLYNNQCRLDTESEFYSNIMLTGRAQEVANALGISHSDALISRNHLYHELLFRSSTQLFSGLDLEHSSDFENVLQTVLYESFTQGSPQQTKSLVAQAKLDWFDQQKNYIKRRVGEIAIFSNISNNIGHSLTQIFHLATDEILPNAINYKLVMLQDFFETLDDQTLNQRHALLDGTGEVTLLQCIENAIKDSRLQPRVANKQTGKKTYEVIVTSLYDNLINNMRLFLGSDNTLTNVSGETVNLKANEGYYLLLGQKLGDIGYTAIFMRLDKFAMRKHNRSQLNGICDALTTIRVGDAQLNILEDYFWKVCGLEDKDKSIFKSLCNRFDQEYQTTSLATAANNKRHATLAKLSMTASGVFREISTASKRNSSPRPGDSK